MKDLVAVRVNIDDCMNDMTTVMKDLDSLEELFSKLNTKISDTSTWSGESQEKAENIQKLITEYEKTLRPIYENLKKEIIELRDLADDFVDDSYEVSKLRAW